MSFSRSVTRTWRGFLQSKRHTSVCTVQAFHDNSKQRQQFMQSQSSPGVLSVHDLYQEPEGPVINTVVPGPNSLAMKKELAPVQNTDSIHFFVDYEKCRGNYVADVDGNMMLDLFQQISSLPIGYNNPRLIEASMSEQVMTAYVTRAATGSYPPKGLLDKFLSILLSVAPKNMTGVTTMGCGACSIESGMKAIFMAYQRRLRGGRKPSEEEKDSSVMNQLPGSPKLSFMSFSNAFHGRSMGALAMSHAKWFHKLDFPVPDWPIAQFPRLKYPLLEYTRENRQEEERCLQHVQESFHEYSRKGEPVAGICVEPVQSEGGDNHATPFFFQELQRITKENGAYLMIDEVQSGCGATGKFWGFEHFNLEETPDVLTFSKKMLSGGFYYKDELKPTEGYRIYNTWMGDLSRVLMLESVLDEIREKDLIKGVADVGVYLQNGLHLLQNRHPSLLSNVRGLGTMCAMDIPTVELRDRMIGALKNNGVNVGGCGDASIRLRPTLLFHRKHADIFLETFDSVLTNIKATSVNHS